MPQLDVIQDHIAAADQTAFDAAMATLETLLQARLHNLTPKENETFGTIKDKNKNLVDKVEQYRDTQPALSSGDVDWTEFKADKFDRKFLESGAARLMGLANAMLEAKRMHDYDNYQNSLVDYQYTKLKTRTSPGLGFDTKLADLKPLV